MTHMTHFMTPARPNFPTLSAGNAEGFFGLLVVGARPSKRLARALLTSGRGAKSNSLKPLGCELLSGGRKRSHTHVPWGESNR